MPLTQTPDLSRKLAEHAAARPEAKALVFRRDGAWRSMSFRELDREADLLAAGLAAAGIGKGVRAALMVKPGPEFFALTLGLFRAGAVPVLIDPGIGLSSLKKCLAEAGPEAFIGIPQAHIARVLLGWGRKTVRTTVTVGRGIWGRSYAELKALGETAPKPEPQSPDDLAAILFTSGSTGIPKGALYTHAIFAAQVEMIQSRFGIQPGDVDVPTFPLFALFGPSMGMTAVIPEMDFTRPGSVDPENVLGPIREFHATQMFGSPALLDRVGRYAAEKGVRLPTLKRVVSAGAPVAPRILARFASILPANASIHTPYGATEALPVATIDHREVLDETAAHTAQGKGVCVGRAWDGMEVSIISITDQAIPEWSDDLKVAAGKVGEICVKGPIVTKGYFGRPEADALSKIRFPDGSLAHRMGDVGYLDHGGRLWFCGRKSHRVLTADGPMFTIPCEGVFNVHPMVKRTALVGVGRPHAQRPVLCVEAEPLTKAEEARLRKELLEIAADFPHTQAIRDILFHPSFPVDIRHNAKIFREKLAVWAEGRV